MDGCCYKYTSLKFDASLASNRITRKEVDEQIDRIHEEVGDFCYLKFSTFCCIGITILCICIFFNNMINSRSNTFMV